MDHLPPEPAGCGSTALRFCEGCVSLFEVAEEAVPVRLRHEHGKNPGGVDWWCGLLLVVIARSAVVRCAARNTAIENGEIRPHLSGKTCNVVGSEVRSQLGSAIGKDVGAEQCGSEFPQSALASLVQCRAADANYILFFIVGTHTHLELQRPTKTSPSSPTPPTPPAMNHAPPDPSPLPSLRKRRRASSQLSSPTPKQSAPPMSPFVSSTRNSHGGVRTFCG